MSRLITYSKTVITLPCLFFCPLIETIKVIIILKKRNLHLLSTYHVQGIVQSFETLIFSPYAGLASRCSYWAHPYPLYRGENEGPGSSDLHLRTLELELKCLSDLLQPHPLSSQIWKTCEGFALAGRVMALC